MLYAQDIPAAIGNNWAAVGQPVFVWWDHEAHTWVIRDANDAHQQLTSSDIGDHNSAIGEARGLLDAEGVLL